METKDIKKYVERQRNELNGRLKKRNSRFNAHIDEKTFRELMTVEGTKVLFDRGVNSHFIIDESNEILIKQLFHYVTGSNQFSGDLFKGIYLCGGYGTGKTTTLKALLAVLSNLSYRLGAKIIHSQKLSKEFINGVEGYMEIMHEPMEIYNKGILFIDDVGKEPTTVNSYGTERRPLIELINSRYEIGSLTFLTSNLKTKTLQERYSGHFADRVKAMMNVFELTGESKRR